MKHDQRPPKPKTTSLGAYMAWIKAEYRNPKDPNGPMITDESRDDDWFWATCGEVTPVNLEEK